MDSREFTPEIRRSSNQHDANRQSKSRDAKIRISDLFSRQKSVTEKDIKQAERFELEKNLVQTWDEFEIPAFHR